MVAPLKDWIARRWIWAAVWPLFFVLPTTVNALSAVTEAGRRGWPLKPWEPFAWEYTSLLASLIAAAPFTSLVVSGWRTREFKLVVGVWVGAAMLYSALHIVLMVHLRNALYAVLGLTYQFGDWTVEGLYELRKDLATCVTMTIVVAAVLLLRRVVRLHEARQLPEQFIYTFGGRVFQVPQSELLYVHACRNYVEIVTETASHTIRRALDDVEQTLANGPLVRTHRSWIVNIEKVRQATPKGSGDWSLALGDGHVAPLSRRYRKAHERLSAILSRR